jgi:two-component system chemotaxis response regulator CheB
VISVLVVDDSGFMRLALRKMLERDPVIRVVAEAATAADAIHMALLHNPDVITMDIEMPGGSGLDATVEIMERSPRPIIVISSLTKDGSETAVQALQKGAVDYISKASSYVDLDIVAIERDLLRKIRYWGEHSQRIARMQARDSELVRARKPGTIPSSVQTSGRPELIVIGASTGGPKALPELFKGVKRLTCPVLIALHMPPIYTESFARHLAEATGHSAREGHDGYRLRDQDVVVAPGGLDTHVQVGLGGGFVMRVRKDPEYTLHPSVDALFLSAARTGRNVAGVVMTGMGEDGRKGATALHQAGHPVIAQSEDSCLVYGMPRAVAEAGVASAVLPLPEIARTMTSWAGAEPRHRSQA